MKTDIFHIFIAAKFKDKVTGFSNNIKRSEAKKVLYNNNIPIHLHNNFLVEMQDLDLIKLKDKQNIEILKKD